MLVHRNRAGGTREARALHSMTSDPSNDYGADLTGWNLFSAKGISADGFSIVGQGTNADGLPEGWIAYVPEPDARLLQITALLTLAAYRRGRR